MAIYSNKELLFLTNIKNYISNSYFVSMEEFAEELRERVGIEVESNIGRKGREPAVVANLGW